MSGVGRLAVGLAVHSGERQREVGAAAGQRGSVGQAPEPELACPRPKGRSRTQVEAAQEVLCAVAGGLIPAIRRGRRLEVKGRGPECGLGEGAGVDVHG